MANMELITSVTVGSGGAASVTLPATGTIPQTYTDLQIVMSVRGSRSEVVSNTAISFNGSTANFTNKYLEGNGTSASSGSLARFVGAQPAATATANTFSNNIIYIPNYTSSNFKSFSCDSVTENNATLAYATLFAGLWSDTSAITTITLSSSSSDNFVEGSTFYLYGISNVTSGSKATGGIVSSDGTYNYHMFPFSGTFTPTQSLTADYLVIAGGGGGGGSGAGNAGTGGGGAGGLRSTVGTTGGGGSLESALSLTAQVYTVTVGAGGAGGIGTGTIPTAGSNSVFSTITSTGGGLGAYAVTGFVTTAGGNGGSGGGGRNNGAGGTGTTNQGYAGGSGSNSGNYGGGGGGGASAVGTNGTSTVAGNGGAGVQITAFANATQTGISNGYYAGGGGGSVYGGGTSGTGGTGGGGAGGTATGSSATNGSAGILNTGSGGGGSGNFGSGTNTNGGNGGSGLVVIRYAI